MFRFKLPVKEVRRHLSHPFPDRVSSLLFGIRSACQGIPSGNLSRQACWWRGYLGTFGHSQWISVCIFTLVSVGDKQLHLQFDLSFRWEGVVHWLRTPIKMKNGITMRPAKVLSTENRCSCYLPSSPHLFSFSKKNFLKNTRKPPARHEGI